MYINVDPSTPLTVAFMGIEPFAGRVPQKGLALGSQSFLVYVAQPMANPFTLARKYAPVHNWRLQLMFWADVFSSMVTLKDWYRFTGWWLHRIHRQEPGPFFRPFVFNLMAKHIVAIQVMVCGICYTWAGKFDKLAHLRIDRESSAKQQGKMWAVQVDFTVCSALVLNVGYKDDGNAG